MSIPRLLACVGLSLCVSASLAQPGEPAKTEPAKSEPAKAEPAKSEPEVKKNINPAAKELLEKANAAGKSVKDLSATVEASANQGDEKNPPAKGKLVIEFKSGMMPIGNWRIDLPAKEGTTIGRTTAYDGKVLRVIDPAAKEMTESDRPGMAYPMGDEGALIPQWFFMSRNDFLKPLNPVITEQVIEGEAAIGGEKTTIVRQVRSASMPAQEEGEKPTAMTETVRLWLAADNLPRRTELSIKMEGGQEMAQTMVQTFTDLKVNTTPAADAYALKSPEGFKVRKVEASDDSGSTELTVKVGDAAKDFTMKDPDGKEYTLADFKGKVVLLDFWATWCGPCVQAMPSIQKIHETFKDKPVVVIGVNTWEKSATAGPDYMKKKGFTYLTLLKGDDLAKAYGISGIPTIILIDGEGKVLHTGVGFGPDEEAHLTKLIGEKVNK